MSKYLAYWKRIAIFAKDIPACMWGQSFCIALIFIIKFCLPIETSLL